MVSGSKAVEPIDCIGTKAVTRDWRHSAKQTSNAHNAPTPKRNNPEAQQPRNAATPKRNNPTESPVPHWSSRTRFTSASPLRELRCRDRLFQLTADFTAGVRRTVHVEIEVTCFERFHLVRV